MREEHGTWYEKIKHDYNNLNLRCFFLLFVQVEPLQPKPTTRSSSIYGPSAAAIISNHLHGQKINQGAIQYNEFACVYVFPCMRICVSAGA